MLGSHRKQVLGVLIHLWGLAAFLSPKGFNVGDLEFAKPCISSQIAGLEVGLEGGSSCLRSQVR